MSTSHLGAAAGYVRVKEKTARGLIEGATDLHAHFAPDSHRERSVNAAELMQTASDLKLRGIALKSKSYPSYPLAEIGKQQHPQSGAATRLPHSNTVMPCKRSRPRSRCFDIPDPPSDQARAAAAFTCRATRAPTGGSSPLQAA